MSRGLVAGLIAAVVILVGGALYLLSASKARSAGPSQGGTVLSNPAAPLPRAAPGAGVVRGQVTLSGAPPLMTDLKRGSDPACSSTSVKDEQVLMNGDRIQNVVVRLVDAPLTGDTPTEPVVVDQKDCMYRPRILAAMAGQPVMIRNEDGTLHNVHTYESGKTLFNNAQPPGSAPIQRAFDHAAMIKLKCDVHPWMTGYVAISPNSFFAVTGADGSFEIKGLPAGTYTLETWHERFGLKTTKVTVNDAAPSEVVVRYSADDRGA